MREESGDKTEKARAPENARYGSVRRRVRFERRALCQALAALVLVDPKPAWTQEERAKTRGIYISQTTVVDREKFEGLLRLCSAFSVDTMIVDLWSISDRMRTAVAQIKDAGLQFVPRVQVFPGGGTEREILRRDYWDKRFRSVEAGLDLGARRIQLDFLRYDTHRPPDRQNTFDILEVLEFFSNGIRSRGARVEVDIFGDAAGGPSDVIGQDLRLMGPWVDRICPMVYPSHYEPHDETWALPYHVVHSSVVSAQKLLGEAPTQITAFVEMFNVRRRMTDEQRAVYVRRQVQGARAAGANGWYAWSSTNCYGLLFDLLAAYGDDFEESASPPQFPG